MSIHYLHGGGPKPDFGNLFGVDGPQSPDERFDTLAVGKGVRVERIVSTGQASPEGFWYDNPHEEWVVLLSGGAALEFEAETEHRTMQPGDYVRIPAHCRHRVAWTHAGEPTFWLAIHYENAAAGAR
ncbi:cupin domain-containing protein [Paraburkholderia sp. BL10I2N1]|uniref:cupin domain-containing protein n=1 Tax=Paraburkholderia sp. BL10I2N1 TaxID=1938796 RepID=UPI0010614FE8|nr:cupin domain-containing protein [Paraburkholderia sp. BL10I2N1]TDN69525.1 cupin 2 domain-containing protein [Paraburkholderia sp. BL10I2N1]